MTDSKNPFTPPSASVQDDVSFAVTLPRPSAVTLAVIILWLDFALGLRHIIVRIASGSFLVTDPLAIIFITLVLMANLVVIAFISQGKRWARLGYTAIAAVAIAWDISPGGALLGSSMGMLLISYVSAALDGFALYLLYSRNAAAWFRAVEQ